MRRRRRMHEQPRANPSNRQRRSFLSSRKHVLANSAMSVPGVIVKIAAIPANARYFESIYASRGYALC